MTIGSPPPGLPPAVFQYLVEIATAVNRLESKRPAKEPWDVTDITELRVLDGATATADDVRQGLCTLLRDLMNHGTLTGNRV